jgi:hypothetical protein
VDWPLRNRASDNRLYISDNYREVVVPDLRADEVAGEEGTVSFAAGNCLVIRHPQVP